MGETEEFLYRDFRYEAYCKRQGEGGDGGLETDADEVVTIRKQEQELRGKLTTFLCHQFIV